MQVRHMNKSYQIFIFALTILFATACAEEDNTQDTCAQAQAHVQACFPNQQARLPDGCTEASAQQVLDQSCDDLANEAQAQEGKADGFCNPWFWWTCLGGSTDTKETTYNFTFRVNVCETETCVIDLFGENNQGADCGLITLENENGEIVAKDYINDHLVSGGVQGTESFKDLDLPEGEYVAKLWRRDGEQAVTVKGEPAQLGVTLLPEGEAKLESKVFRILKTEAEDIRACSDITGSLDSTCNMAPMEDEDIEWGWIVELKGTNGEGTYHDYKRGFAVFNQPNHLFSFRNVRAGEYAIIYHEVDIPSWRRKNNRKFEDYQELVERYGTGNGLSQTLTITDEDIRNKTVFLENVDLDHQDCR